MTAQEDKQRAIDEIRIANERNFGEEARRVVARMLSVVMNHPWMYVYELTQNALDAGATRVAWTQEGDHRLIFDHDGTAPLTRKHVEGLCSVAKSTKGLNSVGFMGVGFKSVFSRFRRATVVGDGWCFQFDVGGVARSDRPSITQWANVLFPTWADATTDLPPGVTTRFILEGSVGSVGSIEEDLRRLDRPNDATPLAVLALRDLREMVINGRSIHLERRGPRVRVRSADGRLDSSWRVFTRSYHPNKAAMQRLLEVRLEDRVDGEASLAVPERRVSLLVPLDETGAPQPHDRGLAYATLPTQVRLPFGLDLQADWLVNVDRQNLRDIADDPWQEEIVRQVPTLIRDYLSWAAELPPEQRRIAYGALRLPTEDDGPMGAALAKLHDDFRRALQQTRFLPILTDDHDPQAENLAAPTEVRRLPRPLRRGLAEEPHARLRLLLGHKLLAQHQLDDRCLQFLSWLNFAPLLKAVEVPWDQTLPLWWASLDVSQARDEDDALWPQGTRVRLLLALWDAVPALEWEDAPLVRTASGAWRRPKDISYVFPFPPVPGESYAEELQIALHDALPPMNQRLDVELEAGLLGHNYIARTGLLALHAEKIDLAKVLERIPPERTPHLALWGWVRRHRRSAKSVFSNLLTCEGPKHPKHTIVPAALSQADTLVHKLYPGLAPLVEGYADVDDHSEARAALRALGVAGTEVLAKHTLDHGTSERDDLEKQHGLSAGTLEGGKTTKFEVHDWTFSFDVESVPRPGFQKWLEHVSDKLRRRGTQEIRWFYKKARDVQTRSKCQWVLDVERIAWVECEDGCRRRPAEVVMKEYDSSSSGPVARIDEVLYRLLQDEGVEFGTAVVASTSLRDLQIRDASTIDLERILVGIQTGEYSREELTKVVESGTWAEKYPVHRVVQRAGSSEDARSDLSGWALPLSKLPSGAEALYLAAGIEIPEEVTGKIALDYLQDVWRRQPRTTRALLDAVCHAFRYMLADSCKDPELNKRWSDARTKAQVLTRSRSSTGEVQVDKRQWAQVSEDMIVDDTGSLVAEGLAHIDVSWVDPSLLGETPEVIRNTARALGIKQLSQHSEFRNGPQQHESTSAARVMRVVHVLQHSMDRSPIEQVTLHDFIEFRFRDAASNVHVRLDEQTLRVAGTAQEITTNTAEELISLFELTTRRVDGPLVTMALHEAVADGEGEKTVQQLADRLGVPLPSIEAAPSRATAPHPIPRRGEEPPSSSGESTFAPVAPVSAEEPDTGRQEASDRARTGTPQTDTAARPVPSAERTPAGSILRDGLGEEAVSNSAGPKGSNERIGGAFDEARDTHKPTTIPSTQGAPRGQRSGSSGGKLALIRLMRDNPGSAEAQRASLNIGGARDDHEAKKLVVEYEKMHGRTATPQVDNQPGYDVISETPGGEPTRYIEIKGLDRVYDGNEVVLLSFRQLQSGIEHHDSGDKEYWLYVVDGLKGGPTTVRPIPWTRHWRDLKAAFEAQDWLQFVVE